MIRTPNEAARRAAKKAPFWTPRRGMSQRLSQQLRPAASPRAQWREFYRTARIIARSEPSKPGAHCRFSGCQWMAIMIVSHDRQSIDPLTIPLAGRLLGKRIIDEILAEG